MSGTGPHRTGRVRGRRTSSRDGVGEWRGAVAVEAFRERAPPGCGRAMDESTAFKGETPEMFLRAEQRSARTTSTGAEASPSRSFLEAGRIPSRLRNKHVEGGRPGHPRPSLRPRARVPRKERRLLRGSATASPSST